MIKKYVILIILVAVIFAGLIYKYSFQSENIADETLSPSPDVSSTGSGNKTGVSTKGSIDATLSYSQAVAKYADRRMQFDAGCQATPKAPVYKNGTNVMFDNRSGDARWFSLNGKAYSLGGYGWMVLTLSSSKLPYTIVVDCGSAQNVTTILLQK